MVALLSSRCHAQDLLGLNGPLHSAIDGFNIQSNSDGTPTDGPAMTHVRLQQSLGERVARLVERWVCLTFGNAAVTRRISSSPAKSG